MPTSYYDVYYINGDYERVFRFEDMIACKFGNKKTKVIKEYKLTEKGWKVRVIV